MTKPAADSGAPNHDIANSPEDSSSKESTSEWLRMRLAQEADVRYQLECSNVAKDYRILQLKGWLRLFVEHPLFGTLIKLKKLLSSRDYVGPEQIVEDELDPDADLFLRQGYLVQKPFSPNVAAANSPGDDASQVSDSRNLYLHKQLATRHISLPSSDPSTETNISENSEPRLALRGRALPDVFIFPIINWEFRFQRPQQLATQLARRGYRVFYFDTKFSPRCLDRRFTVTGNPTPNVYTVKLHCSHHSANVYRDVPSAHFAAELAGAIYDLKKWAGTTSSLAMVDLPFWHRVVVGLAGTPIIYDCMDYHAGFSTNQPDMLNEEEQLMRDADLVVYTSDRLRERLNRDKRSIVIKNAADVKHFRDACSERPGKRRPVVGYYGAISDWFDLDLVLNAARARQQYDFVLIGATFGCQGIPDKLPKNVTMPGERPYSEIPKRLRDFDVCIIPFLDLELTRCTNPVKVYEYLAAGKPVVSTDLPELRSLGELVHIAKSQDEFVSSLDLAMQERAPHPSAKARMRWAAKQSWEDRGKSLHSAIQDLYPKVSVVVLVYNNLALTQQCLESIERHSEYPNLELIVVDNASTKETRSYLKEFARHRGHVKLILNKENLGFAAGNNVGLRAASGEYLVIINNDTYVSEGWLSRMLSHFRDDEELGLLGPVTNNIGDEARIETEYQAYDEMLTFARVRAFNHPFKRLYKEKVAFFCVMLPRTVIDAVGFLDESFGLGFFEDDDYCHRVVQAGYSVAVAEDVFVHHCLSASFNQLPGDEKARLFEKSKAVYEEKWGEWVPHQDRAD